jgi:hypothetical protein
MIRMKYLRNRQNASTVGLSPPPKVWKRYTTRAKLIIKTLGSVRIA